MKNHIKKSIPVLVLWLIAASAFGASPAYENFKSGVFSRTGNTIQIAEGATNAAGQTLATAENLVFVDALTSTNGYYIYTTNSGRITATFITTNTPGSTIAGDVSVDSLEVGVLTVDSIAGTLTNNTTGNAATATVATNLTPTYFWNTNTTENLTQIYATGGGDVPDAVKGLYVLQWSNLVVSASSYRFEGCYTNTASTNIVTVNFETPDPTISFLVTDGTNTDNYLYSNDQITSNPSSGRVWFLKNPYDSGNGTFATVGDVTLTWGTNAVSTNFTRFLGNGDRIVLPQHVPTNCLVVSLQGDDGLANRTNGFPFKTLWAANEAAAWGDYIYVEPGYHQTYGIHMTRGVTVGGAGRNTVIEPLYDTDLNHATFFQSKLISIWDGCTLENLTITNGAVGFTEHDGVILGGTNSLARNLWVYPAYLPEYFNELLQPSYFGVGVKFSRLGTDIKCERVRVYSSALGFSFQSSVSPVPTTTKIDLVDCEAYCDSRYLGTNNYWLQTGVMGFGSTNIGGMIPISFSLGSVDSVFNVAPITVNIIGGRFSSINGATNRLEYVGGETAASRNCGIWFARGHTNQIRLNLSNLPEFVIGNTNTTAQFVLNETTNNNVTLSGSAQLKHVPSGDENQAGTNTVVSFNTQYVGDGGGLTNFAFAQLIKYYHPPELGVSATPFTNYTSAFVNGSMLANISAGTITNVFSGNYQAAFSASLKWTASPVLFSIYTNGVMSSITLTNADALSAQTSVSFSGIIALPANCASDVRYIGDQPEGGSIIFSLRRL